MDESPLVSMDVGKLTLDLAREKQQAEVVVISPLITEAILGLNFLCQHRVKIDLKKY